VRTEIEQDFAGRISKGLKASSQDDTNSNSHEWQGEVLRVSDRYTQRHSVTLEPLQLNDVRTLEVIIRVRHDPKNPLRIGERMRATLEAAK
jgi:hypothetical protein